MVKVVNIPIPADTWVDVNTETSIPVGTDVSAQCTGVRWLWLQESTTEPTTKKEGKLLTNLSDPSAEAIINNTPLKIWARCSVDGGTTSLAVQKLA